MQRSRLIKSSRSAILFLLMGVVSVAAALGGTWLYLRPEPAPPPPKEEPPPKPVPVVLTAANDLNIGTLITASDLVWKPIRNGSVLSTHMLKDQIEESQVIGSVVRRSVYKGMALNWSAIVRPGEHGFLAAALKPDHRAVTIRVDEATSEAALIYPGDHVDVILTAQLHDPTTRQTDTFTATILDNVRVVAVNRQVESGVGRSGGAGGLFGKGSRTAANTVTLELEAGDAERLILARTKGTISLAMRSLTDVLRREDRAPTAFESLLPLPAPVEPEAQPDTTATAGPAPAPAAAQSPPLPPPAPEQPPDITVRIFRGDKHEEVRVTK